MSDSPVCIQERYHSASQASNLRMETREDSPVGSIGVVIAAGWSRARMGAALLRLHTKPDRKELEAVWGQIAGQAARWGIERPGAVGAAVLAWWLKKNCKACTGRGLSLLAGGAMSTCKTCKGVGEEKIPHGEDGKSIAGWLDQCRDRGAQGIQAGLSCMRK